MPVSENLTTADKVPASDGLRSKSFWGLVLAQFLGAFNDNAYKMIVMIVVSYGIRASEGGAFYLALSTGVFSIAFILFSSSAGYLADRFSKRSVIVWAKAAEIAIMAMAFFALLAGDRISPIIVLFLMAAQSAFFSPAKYGILPEILTTEELSRGNAIINTTTYIAIILGTGFSGILLGAAGSTASASGSSAKLLVDPYIIALVLVVIAAAGTTSALMIRRTAATGSAKKFSLNFLADSVASLRRVKQDMPLFLCILASMYLWVFGACYIQNFTPYAREILRVESEMTISLLAAMLGLGVAAGSIIAGKLSGEKIEFGLVPLGAIGMTLGSFAFLVTALPYDTGDRVFLTGLNLIFVGASCGLYFVPINAFIQKRSPKDARGDTIAVMNFITFIGILGGAGLIMFLSMKLKFNPAYIFAAIGVATAAAAIYICYKLPEFLLRFVMWVSTHTVYKLRIVGLENVPKDGPALLVCNHVALVDPALITACFQRFIRFVMYREYYNSPLLHWGARLMRAIPISNSDPPRQIAASLKEAREALNNGELVCIFAEGSLTRTGNLRGFRPGLEHITKGTNAPIIPVHLDRVWGSVFSFKGGIIGWKVPRALPYPVTISFGKPLPPTTNAHHVRTAVAELGAEAFEYRKGAQVLLHHAFVRAAKTNWFKPCMADSSGRSLRYGSVLVASLALSKKIKKLDDAEYVGIMMPASVPGALANIAVLMAGKIPVNLNFTASKEAIDSAIEQCNIKTIITSKIFVAKARLEERKELVMLEGLAAKISVLDKSVCAVKAFCEPTSVFNWTTGRRGLKPTDTATVIFTSGTTGTPKGVVLSHKNIASNIVGFCQTTGLSPSDCMCGVLPFFHSFGLTTTLWAPLLRYFRVVYHPNPLDAAGIGKLIGEHKATYFVATPTFLKAYIRKCEPSDLASLKMVVVGAEKLRDDVADAFEEKFGVRPLEGYGCTELAPVASVNVPDVAVGRMKHVGTKPGTIGQPLPNVAARVVDIETGEELPANTPGLLLIKGPNVMAGYLNRPDETAKVIENGWYRTGDIASIDEDGFIKITDRLSRFSKIGGEMIPHMAIEEAIMKVIGADPSENILAVTAVPDKDKGERLAVVHTPLPVPVDELHKKLLTESGLPPLWIPKKDMFFEVENIPVLGTGKVALREIKTIAEELSNKLALKPGDTE